MIYLVRLGTECEKSYCVERVDSLKKILARDRATWGKPALLSMLNEKIYWNDILDSKTRNMIRKAYNVGVKCEPINKNEWLGDVDIINKSSLYRQGRVMSVGYRKFPRYTNYKKECDKHYWIFIGAFLDEKLIAYTSLLPCGELLLVSQILGHKDYFHTGVMNYVLFCSIVYMMRTDKNLKVAQYDFWNSGTDGMRHFKKSMGFLPNEIKEYKKGDLVNVRI